MSKQPKPRVGGLRQPDLTDHRTGSEPVSYSPPWMWTWGYRHAPSELPYTPTGYVAGGRNDDEWRAYLRNRGEA